MKSTATGPILVGYDGSDEANAALDWALDEAGRTGQPIDIVYAFELATLGGWVGPGTGPGIWPDEVARREVAALLRSAERTAATSHPGVHVRAELLDGPPSLLLRQRSEQAALVALGSRGHGGFVGLPLGSTAVAVTSHAHCPVVVVRRPAAGTQSVAVGVDGSPSSQRALEFALTQAASRRVALRAVRVWQPPTAPWRSPKLDLAAVNDTERAALDRSLAGWRDRYPEVDVRPEVVAGNPAVVLIEASREAQLTVVGSRGLGGFRGLVLGSVSHQLVQHAEAPVAVVHELGTAAGM